ncbi:FAD:protein FMN transferase [Vibrio marisflavi]|nr:FAD:protein FMN transferase [Vibrio marisflavi]
MRIGNVVKVVYIRIALLSLIALVLSGCGEQPKLVALTGTTMGTYYSIKWVEQEGVPAPETVRKEVQSLLEQVNAQMSTYRSDSELSRFNQLQSLQPFAVSTATAKVVKEALRLSKLSDGAYDITVGPIVNLWSFGPEARPEKIPSDELIQERMAEVGYHHLTVLGNNRLVKDIPHLYVDLSSIAKGYGVDLVFEYLKDKLHIRNLMVDIGGEMRVQGENPSGVPWRIAIEKPLVNERAVQEIIEVGDNAIATSGDYRNYFEENGVRYSHLINPRTGKPIQNRVVSVTVIDKSCMTADGYATMFSIMGEQESIALANRENIPLLLIVKTNQGFEEFRSDTFDEYIKR